MRSTWLLSLGGAALVATLATQGCSSSDDEPTPGNDGGTSSSSSGDVGTSSSGGGSSSGGSSSGGTSSSSSSSGAPADGGLACYTPANATGWSATIQRARSNDCTALAIEAIWTACAGEGATDATCTAAGTANASCFNCLTGKGEPATRKTGIFSFEGGVATPYSDVCAANAIGQADECGTKADNLASCTVGGCEACFEVSEAATEECTLTVEAGPCAQYVPTVDCEELLSDEDNEDTILEHCGDVFSDEVSEEDFETAAFYMCGPPPI